MQRYRVYLMSGRTLHVNAEDKRAAERYAVVWHQMTDAVLSTELDASVNRPRVPGVVKVTKEGA